MKKSSLIFILSILLFLAIGAASAADDNSTDIVQADSDDEPLSIDNSSQEISGSDSEVLSSGNDSAIGNSEISEANDVNSTVVEPSKLSLKVTTTSNFVNPGGSYDMYLYDQKNNAVAGKKVTVTFNGKTYKRTTASDGRFSVPVNTDKDYVKIKVSYDGDKKYAAFSKTLSVKVEKKISIDIANKKLLTKGYLRIYLHGPLKKIAKKKITVKVGNKVFKQKTDKEGNLIIKPKAAVGKHWVTVIYGNLETSKKIKCIKGNVINPFKKVVPLRNGVPNVDFMPKNFVMGYDNAQYFLKRANYFEVMDRDSYSLFMYGKMSKYTFFKTKLSPKVYHVLKREKWNVIEREIFTKVVKKNKYDYWPKTISVDLEGKSYTYSEVRDIQNTGYTCGPTSASVCTQVLKNFHTEKYFQVWGGVTNGINIPDLKNILEKNKCSAYYFYDGSSFDSAIKQLKKGAALIAYLPNHYVAVIDVSPDGKKVLVSNSYGSYDSGSKGIPTDWVSVKKLKSKFAGVGLVVKPSYNLSKNVKKEVKKCFYSMGGGWTRQNVNERIPNIGL